MIWWSIWQFHRERDDLATWIEWVNADDILPTYDVWMCPKNEEVKQFMVLLKGSMTFNHSFILNFPLSQNAKKFSVTLRHVDSAMFGCTTPSI